MTKKFLFLLLLIVSLASANLVNADIIPLKKPSQTKAETEKKLLIDVLKPLPKPIKNVEIKQIEEKVVIKKKIENNLILPKKKTFNSRS